MAKLTTPEVSKDAFETWYKSGDSVEKNLGGITGFQAKRNSHSATFRLRYFNEQGTKRYYKIGNYPDITYDIARKEAVLKSSTKVLGTDIQAVRIEKKIAIKNTLEAYLDEMYIVTAQQQSDGKAVIQGIKNHFPDLLDKPLMSVTKKYISTWQADKIKQNEIKPRTISKLYASLKTVLTHAVNTGYLKESPLRDIKLTPMTESEAYRQQKSQERKHLSKQEVRSFFKGLDLYEAQKRSERASSIAHGKPYLESLDYLAYTSYVRPYLELMFYSAIRPSDLRQLQWSHVNLQFKTIKKVLSKTAHKKAHITVIPLSDLAIEVLIKWHVQNGKPKTGLLFPSGITGGELSKNGLDKQWTKIKALGGLPEELHMYTLRHHLPSELIMNGASTLAVAKILGHANTKMIEQHYGHLAPTHLHSIINQLSNHSDTTQEDSKNGTANN
jgi:integrase